MPRSKLILFANLALFLCACRGPVRANPHLSPAPNLKAPKVRPESKPVTIAFIGDQGYGKNSRAVLELIKAEGADCVLHQGDFDYRDRPVRWEKQINDVLGEKFPYFACIGNHDEEAFFGPNGYQSFIAARLKRLGMEYQGDPGVRFSLTFKTIFMVFSAPGLLGNDPKLDAVFIRDQFSRSSAPWRVSSWHKNQRDMQAGGKGNGTGWDVYEESRRAGAIIATGHEHSYSRTHLLARCEIPLVASKANTLELAIDDPKTPKDEGRSFVFVSGLGGQSIRVQKRDGPWWACIFTKDQDANHGALFGVFETKGDELMGEFYFKTIDGRIIDRFQVKAPRRP
ncbi:MAG: metallophosphoesterase [Planctomycetota bacterium]|nr:metallophosphoesterase [Planctomycetota bacterium]